MTENEAIEQLEVFPEWNREDRWLDVGDMEELVNICIKALEEIQQYRAIGTVEECREAREKQWAKKVNNRTLLRDLNGDPYAVRGDCPNCGKIGLLSDTDYCNACGKKLDWSE